MPDFKVSPFNPEVVNMFEMNLLSQEAVKAQRQAEWENLSAYRARHIEAYKAWSENPEKAKEILEKRRIDTGERIVKGLNKELKYEWAPYKDQVKATPVVKARPKQSWWKRIASFIRRF